MDSWEGWAFLFLVGGGVIVSSIVSAIGSAAKTVGGAAMRNPGSSIRGGLELWKFFNK